MQRLEVYGVDNGPAANAAVWMQAVCKWAEVNLRAMKQANAEYQAQVAEWQAESEQGR